MTPFRGYAPGGVATAIPNEFFAAVMPLLDDPVELAVAIYTFFAIGRKRQLPRHVSRRELLAEEPLRRCVANMGREPDTAITRALAAAAARGALVAVTVDRGVVDDLYLLNTTIGRRDAARIRAGLVPLGRAVEPPPPAASEQRPTIFRLYEDTIGTLTPAIVTELGRAEEEYRAEWIERAFQQAAVHRARSWSYVKAVLERMSDEGTGDETSRRDDAGLDDGSRYVSGRYGQYLRE